MEFGLFMMPLHPPRRSFADSYDRENCWSRPIDWAITRHGSASTSPFRLFRWVKSRSLREKGPTSIDQHDGRLRHCVKENAW